MNSEWGNRVDSYVYVALGLKGVYLPSQGWRVGSAPYPLAGQRRLA
jgi:hypothetical protein